MKNLVTLCSLTFLGFPLLPSSADAGDAPCPHHQDGACEHPEAAQRKAGPSKKGGALLRGEKISGAPNTTLVELLRAPESRDGKKVVVEGKVRRACQRRGCWMELAEDEKGLGVRVTFKDYGFFVPTDSAGAKAKVAGTVKVVELSEAAAAHYKSEGAIIPGDSAGKPRDVQIVATGVELRR